MFIIILILNFNLMILGYNYLYDLFVLKLDQFVSEIINLLLYFPYTISSFFFPLQIILHQYLIIRYFDMNIKNSEFRNFKFI